MQLEVIRPRLLTRIEQTLDQADLDRYAEYFQQFASLYRLSEHDKTALHNAHLLFIAGVLLKHGKIAVAVINPTAN